MAYRCAGRPREGTWPTCSLERVLASVQVELAFSSPGPSTRRIAALGVNVPDLTVVAMMLAVETGCPVGEVQLGTLRWRFGNRVEMLEAIDAACEEATRTSELQPISGDRQ
jgi:hypothetical protein